MAKLTTSVALCTCNGAAFLQEQLSSILNQTVPVDEIVICDDVSDDDTVGIAKQIVAASSFAGHCLVERNQHRLGPGLNFRKCIKYCTGDVVFLCDQDDVWKPTKVEKLLACFQNDDVVLAFSDAETIDRAGMVRTHSLIASSGILNPAWQHKHLDDAMARVGKSPNGCLIAFKREAILPYLDNEWCSWHDGWITHVAALVGDYAYISEPLTQYRVHEGNLTVSPAKQKEYIAKVQSVDEYDKHFQLHEFRIARCDLFSEVLRLSGGKTGCYIEAYRKAVGMCDTLRKIKVAPKRKRIYILCQSVIMGEYRYRYRDPVQPFGARFVLRLWKTFCLDVVFLLKH